MRRKQWLIILGMLVTLPLLGFCADAAASDGTHVSQAEAKVLPNAEQVAVSAQMEEEEEDWGDDWDDPDWGMDNGKPKDVPPEQIYDLTRCIEIAMERNQAIKAANWDVQYYDAKASEAWWAWFPSISFRSLIAPAPDYSDAPDPSDMQAFLNYRSGDWWDFNSVIWGNRASLTMPLYTFGKIRSVRKMGPLAKHGGRLQRRVIKGRIAHEVKRAYYTLQFTNRMNDSLDEAIHYLEEAESKLDRLLEKGSESVSDTDRYELEVVRVDIEARKAEAKRSTYLLHRALQELMNLPKNTPLYLDHRILQSPTANPALKTFEGAQKAMELKRPEYELLDLDVKLKQKEADRKFADYFPNFFLRLQYDYVYSPEIQDLKHPYLNDPYNVNSFTGFIGLQYDLDFNRIIPQNRQAEAKLHKSQHMRDFKRGMMSLELEQAYEKYLEKLEQVKINENGMIAGKKWMVAEWIRYDVGTTSTSDLVKAVAAYFKTQFYYHAAVHAVYLAESKLQFLMGVELEELAGPQERLFLEADDVPEETPLPDLP